MHALIDKQTVSFTAISEFLEVNKTYLNTGSRRREYMIHCSMLDNLRRKVNVTSWSNLCVEDQDSGT